VRCYFDTSALAKRYVRETGTETVLTKCNEATEVILSVICLTELVSAFNRLLREKTIARGQYGALKKEAYADFREAYVVEISPEILQDSIFCLESAALRALDAIHIATARRTSCDIFISADGRQCKAANKLGLQVFHVAK
jgi:predicted nucleic acid-binding protein